MSKSKNDGNRQRTNHPRKGLTMSKEKIKPLKRSYDSADEFFKDLGFDDEFIRKSHGEYVKAKLDGIIFNLEAENERLKGQLREVCKIAKECAISLHNYEVENLRASNAVYYTKQQIDRVNEILKELEG